MSMVPVSVRQARTEDVEWVAANLREEDRIEVETATGDDPVAVLRRSFQSSQEKYAVFIEGSEEPCALFGVHSGSPGIVWLLCTPEVTKHTRKLLKLAEAWVKHLSAYYGGLQALAWTGNYLHVRWCEHLGFVEFGRAKINGQEFVHLYRGK